MKSILQNFTVLTIFKCIRLVALSAFTYLCNLHHHPIPEPFHHPKLKLYPSLSLPFSPSFVFVIAILIDGKWYLSVVLIYISLMISDGKHHFMCFWPFVYLLSYTVLQPSLSSCPLCPSSGSSGLMPLTTAQNHDFE